MNILNYAKGWIKSIQVNKQRKDIYRRFKDFTMIPEKKYINNLRLAEKISHLNGSVVECGVWRGGMIAGIANILGSGRTYLLFDSFEGLPPAKEIDGEAALEWQKNITGAMYFDNCSAPKEFAEKAMSLSNATSYFLEKGWFEETLPNFTFNAPIALLRLDADWYDSTMTCLRILFPLVEIGGIIILDDYYTWDGCSKSLHAYLSSESRSERIFSFDGICYLRKRDK